MLRWRFERTFISCGKEFMLKNTFEFISIKLSFPYSNILHKICTSSFLPYHLTLVLSLHSTHISDSIPSSFYGKKEKVKKKKKKKRRALPTPILKESETVVFDTLTRSLNLILTFAGGKDINFYFLLHFLSVTFTVVPSFGDIR